MKASRVSRETVAALRAQGFSVRDTASLMGVTAQRVSQLAHA